jgi:hypothetical protein
VAATGTSMGSNKEMKNKLIGMEFAVEVVQTVLMTGQLAGADRLALLVCVITTGFSMTTSCGFLSSRNF